MPNDALRQVEILPGFQRTADGSALISFGNTRVLCAASITPGVPPFLRGQGRGWLTAEYSMLPGSTTPRKARPGIKQDGRATEIQRLIGRSLRAAVDFEALGENTISIDCDVLEADGGTRCASITGGFVALALACAKWVKKGDLAITPVCAPVAAVSVGLVNDQPVLDLDYALDSAAQVDMNIVSLGDGRLIEVQGTGEKRGFDRGELGALLDLAQKGIDELMLLQRQALGSDALYVRMYNAPLVIATQNPGKLREFKAMLGKRFSNILSLADAGCMEQAEETESTFEGNAIVKAEHAARMTGCAALADDSGLEVDTLHGEPGVYSARYAGEGATDEQNLSLLLKRLSERQGPYPARFVCCAALARPGKPTIVCRGTVEGEMTLSPRGDNGFGYDPAFIATGDTSTFGELPSEVKNKKSHRSNALNALMDILGGEA